MNRPRNKPVARSRQRMDYGPAAGFHTKESKQTSRVQRYPHPVAVNTAAKRQVTVWRLATYWVMGILACYVAGVLALTSGWAR